MKDTREDEDRMMRERFKRIGRTYPKAMRVFLSAMVGSIVALSTFAILHNLRLALTGNLPPETSLVRFLGCGFGVLVSTLLAICMRDLWLAERISDGRSKNWFL